MAGTVFDRACCVKCNFTGTTVAPDSHGRGGSFESACLQGADFTDHVARRAPTSSTPAVRRRASPGNLLANRGVQTTVNRAGTVLPASATSSKTVCPDTSNGPCTGTQLSAAGEPTAWPVVTRQKV